MKALVRQTLFAIVCLAIIGNTACTSLQTIDASPEAVAEHNIEPGDKVRLYFADGTQEEITVTAVGELGITGTGSDGLEVVADYDEVVAMKFEEVDGRKTTKNTGMVIGIAVLSAVVLGALAAAAQPGYFY